MLPPFDLWIALVLGAGLLIPYLGRMISEEIGERKRGAFGATAARIALAVVILYVGGRGILHSRATNLLRSRDYRGEAPQNVGGVRSIGQPVGLARTGVNFRSDRRIEHFSLARGAI